MNQVPLILVAEDDSTMRYLAKRQLAMLGYDCEIAVNGFDAVNKANSKRYDLIFMDIQMPIMSGFEATHEIRRFEEDEEREDFVPIVAMTARPEKKRCYDLGMNDFMFKPISLQDMKKVLSRWIPIPPRAQAG